MTRDLRAASEDCGSEKLGRINRLKQPRPSACFDFGLEGFDYGLETAPTNLRLPVAG